MSVCSARRSIVVRKVGLIHPVEALGDRPSTADAYAFGAVEQTVCTHHFSLPGQRGLRDWKTLR
jgi:hypothetical protein